MKDIHNEYSDILTPHRRAKFLTIYIAEAHARDEWWLPNIPKHEEGGRACILQHKNISSRIYAARSFVEDFDLKFEVVCDSMTNTVYESYNGWPERVYIIEKGLIVYQGGAGPFHYNLMEVKDWLRKRFCDAI